MSLENVEVVDAVGLEQSSDTIVLTIADSWDWLDERGHLLALQAKLNAYFGFIESGQIFESYPEAKGKPLRIDLIARYPSPQACISFFEQANTVAEQLGVTFTKSIRPGG